MSAVARSTVNSQALLGRTVSTNKTTATKVSAPVRSNALSAQAVFRTGAVNGKRSLFAAPSKNVEVFRSLQITATAFDGEAAESEAAPAPVEAAPAQAGNSKLYVGNLSWGINSDELRDVFESHGSIVSCDVVTDPTGRSRGFGFVEFSTVEEATGAAGALNQQLLDGRELRVNFHQPRDPNAPRPERTERPRWEDDTCRIYVGNLPWSFDDFDLQDTFSEFGDVLNARVVIDRETGRSRGFGFVTMGSEDEVATAIDELDGSVCDGRNIRVNKAGQR